MNKTGIAIIDSTGDEFWYRPKNAVLMPGIFIKRWTKKRIIDLYNGTCMKPEMEYHRSYSNRLLRDVVKDICTLITENTGSISIMSVNANK